MNAASSSPSSARPRRGHADVEVVGGDATRRGRQAAQGGHEQAPEVQRRQRDERQRDGGADHAHDDRPVGGAVGLTAAQLLDPLLQRAEAREPPAHLVDAAPALARQLDDPRAARPHVVAQARRVAADVGVDAPGQRVDLLAPAAALRHERAQAPQLAGHVQPRAAERVEELGSPVSW